MAWGAALMDFDNNGFVDFISTSGKIASVKCVAISSIASIFASVFFNKTALSLLNCLVRDTSKVFFYLLVDLSTLMMMHVIFCSGNDFNKMHLWQNLGASQNGKTQEVRCHMNWFSQTEKVYLNQETSFLLKKLFHHLTYLEIPIQSAGLP